MELTFNLALANDIAQVAILYFAFYGILKAAKGSRFGQVLMGAGILFAVLMAFTYLFKFDVLARILQWLLIYLALSSVVVFQSEVRRFLAMIGALLFQDRNRYTSERAKVTPELFTEFIMKLARRKIGALIAFERGISLRGHQATGVTIDAIPSAELLVSIFTEPMPLHDGGVIIRHGRIAAAHCLFPVSSNAELSETGMRHRAAVGLSEETDALVVVVSEERGLISVAHGGKLLPYTDLSQQTRTALERRIRKAMPVQKTLSEILAEWIKRRRRNQNAEPAEGTPDQKTPEGKGE